MTEQIKNALVHTGATWVLWLLGALSAISVAVMLERARVFRGERGDVSTLVRDLHRLLARGDLDGARSRLAQSSCSAAIVTQAGLGQWEKGATAASEAMAAASGLQRTRLERRLLFLGTVGNNAPFIGLLGTVIGVVGAFEELGRSSLSVGATATQLAPERVMSTIAEALVATAAGLVVAIPAVAVFNYFQGLLSQAMNDADTLAHVLLTHIDISSSSKSASPPNVRPTPTNSVPEGAPALRIASEEA
jgi:biopolymer transport protein ExbB